MRLRNENMPENLDSTEWNLTEAWVNVFDSLKQATVFICAENYPTLTSLSLYIGLTELLREDKTISAKINKISNNLRRALKII